MKTIFLIVCALALTSAKKENSDLIDGILDDPKLAAEFYKVVKRLGIDIPDKQPQTDHTESDQPTCRNNVYKNTIIRTSDSRKAGAKFLVSVENVKSNEQCYTECCRTDGCDLSVYGEGNKTKHNCYLFHCKDELTNENKCLFNNYTGYVSSTVSKINPPQVKSKSEDIVEDVDSLKQWKEPQTTSLPSTTSTPKPTPPPTERPHTVALGDICHSKFSCEDPNAQCSEGLCQCRDTFYKKLRVCRQICIADKEFECRARGTSRRGPDCIAVSLVCDGTHDCADGSDEQNCPTQVATMVPSLWLSKSNTQPSSKENSVDKYDEQMTSSDRNLWLSKSNPQPSSKENSVDKYDEQMTSSDRNLFGYPPFDQNGDWDYSEENSDQLDNSEQLKNTKLNSMEEDSVPVVSSTRGYPNTKSTDDEQKEYEIKKAELRPKNTMPIISWVGDGDEPNRNTHNKQTLQDELSSSPEHSVNKIENQRGNDIPNQSLNELSQDRGENIDTHKFGQYLPFPSKPRGDRPEALPRPNPKGSRPESVQHPKLRGDRPEALPRPTQTVQSSPGITIPHGQVSKTSSVDDTGESTIKSDHFDSDDWSDYVKNSDLSPPLKSIHSTPDLPYNTDQLGYHQSLPYQPSEPYQPALPQYGPNQAAQPRYGANQQPRSRYGASQALQPRYGVNPASPPRYGANQPPPPGGYGANQPGQYPGYPYPGYNQQYPGYNIDYQDYNPYMAEQDQHQDLSHPDIPAPVEPSYVKGNPGGGYIPKAGPPGRLPNHGVGRPPIDKVKEPNDKSLESPQLKTPHNLPPTDTDTKTPGKDKTEEPHSKFDVHHSSTKNNKDDANIHRKTSQTKTDSLKNKGKETVTSNTKDKTTHNDLPIVKPSTPKQNPTKSHSDSKSKTEQNKVNVVKQKETFVTKEKVIVASLSDNAEGPIVALSLGLAITLVLLVFVGCRLRNVRRRLRKGRPLHSNEADYLINGMYL